MSEVIKELKLIVPQRFHDDRGFFSELYNHKKFETHVGKRVDWKQDNHSFSYAAGTVRGLHFQAPPYAQSKLVRCGQGALFDVAVDIRIGSPTYGHWEAHHLSAENGHQFYIPVGFAHGFVTLLPDTEIVYRCSNYFAPESEGSLNWNDSDIGIDWPIETPSVLSEKDRLAPAFKDFQSPFVWELKL